MYHWEGYLFLSIIGLVISIIWSLGENGLIKKRYKQFRQLSKSTGFKPDIIFDEDYFLFLANSEKKQFITTLLDKMIYDYSVLKSVKCIEKSRLNTFSDKFEITTNFEWTKDSKAEIKFGPEKYKCEDMTITFEFELKDCTKIHTYQLIDKSCSHDSNSYYDAKEFVNKFVEVLNKVE